MTSLINSKWFLLYFKICYVYYILFVLVILQLCAACCYKESAPNGVHCAAESVASQSVEKLANADLSCKKNSGII